jgi:hypothetical protein
MFLKSSSDTPWLESSSEALRREDTKRSEWDDNCWEEV